MCVAPAEEVVVADVHASGVSDLSVYDHYLAVVTVVELRQQEDVRVGELHDLHSGLLHLIVVAFPDRDVRNVFMYETHLYAFACLLHQQLLYLPAAVILQEVEILEMDVVLCGKQVIDKGFQLSAAGCYYLDLIVAADGKAAVLLEQAAQSAVSLADVLFLSCAEEKFLGLLARPFFESVEELSVPHLEYAWLAEIQTEYDVKDEADDREHADNQDPGHLPAGILIVIQYHQYRSRYQENTEYGEHYG